jgi:hypothetical protein
VWKLWRVRPAACLSAPVGSGRNRVARAILVGVWLSSAGAACGTSYQPQPTARVGVVIHGGAALYVKNGRETSVGPLGGDLEELVAETPAAAAHAHTARTQLSIGIPFYVVGIAGVFIGLVVLGGPVGLVVIGAGAATGGTGLGFMGAGFTHAVDAVNIHNDAVGGK